MSNPARANQAIGDLTFRAATPADWDLIADLLNRRRRADGIDEIESAAELASQLPEATDFRIARDIRIALVEGEPVGLACGRLRVRDDTLVGETWGAVAPEWRRRGIGSALLARTIEALAPVLLDDPRDWPRELRSYVDEAETADIELLRSAGFVPIRFGFEMRRSLTGVLPSQGLPAGLELRRVTPEHHRAIFDADAEAFRDHWGRAEPTEGDFANWYSGPGQDPSLWQVAWDGDEVAGVVKVEIFHDENEALGIRRGWLDRVSVRRPWRGRGLAKALCAQSFAVLRDHGMTEAWLGVDAANPTGALRLYEGLGFTVARRWQAYGRPFDAPAPAGWKCASDRATMGA